MTSVAGEFAQIPENKLYIATGSFTLLDTSGIVVSGQNAVSVASGDVLRDMGSTVVLTTGDILRKVQKVPTAGTDANGFSSGYIKLGGATYGGSGAGTSAVVRLN